MRYVLNIPKKINIHEAIRIVELTGAYVKSAFPEYGVMVVEAFNSEHLEKLHFVKSIKADFTKSNS